MFEDRRVMYVIWYFKDRRVMYVIWYFKDRRVMYVIWYFKFKIKKQRTNKLHHLKYINNTRT